MREILFTLLLDSKKTPWYYSAIAGAELPEYKNRFCRVFQPTTFFRKDVSL